MPLLALIALWVILSLIAAPAIGALFVPRHRSDVHRHVEESGARGKGLPDRRGEGQGE